MTGKKLIVNYSELPLILEVRGDSGKRLTYSLVPASKKLGVCMNKIFTELPQEDK